jgi:hypothetical protein
VVSCVVTIVKFVESEVVDGDDSFCISPAGILSAWLEQETNPQKMNEKSMILVFICYSYLLE